MAGGPRACEWGGHVFRVPRGGGGCFGPGRRAGSQAVRMGQVRHWGAGGGARARRTGGWGRSGPRRRCLQSKSARSPGRGWRVTRLASSSGPLRRMRWTESVASPRLTTIALGRARAASRCGAIPWSPWAARPMAGSVLGWMRRQMDVRRGQRLVEATPGRQGWVRPRGSSSCSQARVRPRAWLETSGARCGRMELQMVPGASRKRGSSGRVAAPGAALGRQHQADRVWAERQHELG